MTDGNPLLEIINETLRRGRDQKDRSESEAERVVELRPLFAPSDLLRN